MRNPILENKVSEIIREAIMETRTDMTDSDYQGILDAKAIKIIELIENK